MRTYQRNEKIRSLSVKHSQVELAEMFKLSPTRIGQILKPKKISHCLIHKRYYEDTKGCKLCAILAHYENLLSNGQIQEEIAYLCEPDRSIEKVYMRCLLIKHLKNNQGKTFAEIGRLLKRDHSSIIHLYYKEI